MALEWPSILRETAADWFLQPMNAFGPITPSGRDVTGLDAGFWVAALSDYPLRTANQIREWRGVIAALEGGLNEIIVGPSDCRQAPRPLPGLGISVSVPHSD